MNRSTLRFGAALLTTCLLALPAAAQMTAEQIARLGNDLTPLGGERAGNADGSIPEWTGRITTPPDGYVVGEHHRDPYGDDQPLFVINAANLDEHRDSALGRTPAHAGNLSVLRDAGLPDPAQRLGAAAHLRRHARHCRHGAPGGRRQRRRRRGDRHPVFRPRATAWKPSGTTCCATAARRSRAPSARPR